MEQVEKRKEKSGKNKYTAFGNRKGEMEGVGFVGNLGNGMQDPKFPVFK